MILFRDAALKTALVRNLEIFRHLAIFELNFLFEVMRVLERRNGTCKVEGSAAVYMHTEAFLLTILSLGLRHLTVAHAVVVRVL